MAILARSSRATQSARRRSLGGQLLFDWLAVGLSAILVGGIYLDGWAHNHQAGLETFFTPWHAVLYSGYGLLIGFLLARLGLNWWAGRSLAAAPLAGYELALLGGGLFALGGLGDMFWHIAFGIERGVEALLSPTHLLLAAGATLLVSGPLCAAWRRPATDQGGGDWRAELPALLSLTLGLAVVAFITFYAHPYVQEVASGRSPVNSRDLTQAFAVSGMLIQTVFLIGSLLLFLRRWSLRPGWLTILFGLTAALLSVLEDNYWAIGVGLATGLLADLLAQWLRPGPTRPAALRLFAALVPALWLGLYFLALQPFGLWWSVHSWLGAITSAALTGLLLSLLVGGAAAKVTPE